VLAISDGHVDVFWVRGLCIARICLVGKRPHNRFMFVHTGDGSDFGLISEIKLCKEVFLATLIALLNIAYAFLKSRMFIALMFL